MDGEPVVASKRGGVGSIVREALYNFVWADLRDGLLRLDGLPWLTRVLVWGGFMLLFAMLGVLLIGDWWRTTFELRALANGIPGRGTLVPVALVPVTFFLLTIAWGFILTGALHITLWLRVLVFGFYFLVVLEWFPSFLLTASWPERLIALGAMLLLALIFLWRAFAPQRPALELALVLTPMALLFAVVHTHAVILDELSGIPSVLGVLQASMITYRSLAIPLLAVVGLDIALFTLQLAHWGTRQVGTHLPRAGVYGALLLVAGWRLWEVAQNNLEYVRVSSGGVWLGYLGAAIGVLLTIAVWWGLRQLGSAGPPTVEAVAEAAERSVYPLALLFFGATLLAFFLLTLAAAAIVGYALGEIISLVAGLILLVLLAAANLINNLLDPWQLLVSLLAVGGAVWLARRGRPALALYLGIFGVRAAWNVLTNARGLLSFFYWRGDAPLELWWALLLLGVGLWWALRGRLSAQRATNLLSLWLITLLLGQPDFIGDPFSPFFGWAGIAFVAFGIAWDALTSGGWANQGSRALPRSSRIFVYLGYLLLTVTLINWNLVTHDLEGTAFLLDDVVLAGISLFGRPLLYAAILLTLAHPDENWVR